MKSGNTRRQLPRTFTPISADARSARTPEAAPDEFGIEPMPAPMGRELADHIATGQRQIADQIEHLVADAFVGKPQLVVDRAVAVENQQVFERRPLAQSLREQPIGLGLENERAAGGQLVAKCLGRDRQVKGLPADRVAQPVIEPVAQGQFGSGGRAGLDPALVVADARDLADDELAAQRVLLDDPRSIETFDERLAGAVAAGEFRLIDPNLAIVDLQAEQRGQHVLGHFDRGPQGLERRAARRLESIADQGRNRHPPRRIGSHEHDPRVLGGRAKFQADIASAPIAEPCQGDRFANRALLARGVSQGKTIHPRKPGARREQQPEEARPAARAARRGASRQDINEARPASPGRLRCGRAGCD